jgi:[ribosomal protein S18]-alanine N-acetyltransferase
MRTEIRRMQADDVTQVVSIENRWPFLSKWGEEGYQVVLRDPNVYTCLVAEDMERHGGSASRLTGFSVVAQLVDHCELCNLVVSPEYLSKGVGYQLIQSCFEVARYFHLPRIFLEVRMSNHRAITFYERNGFRTVAQRKRYYSNPQEDAWVMQKVVEPSVSPDSVKGKNL